MAGSSIQEIKMQGDWASGHVYLYLRVRLQKYNTADLWVANLLAAVSSPA